MKPSSKQVVNKEVKEADRELFRHQFKKTRICTFFAEGRCRRGDDCTFSHGSVQIAPDLTKTSLCKAWKTGNCTFPSGQCPFAHGKRELRQTPLFKSTRKADMQRNQGEKCLPVGELPNSKVLPMTLPFGEQPSSKAPLAPSVPLPVKFQIPQQTKIATKPKKTNKISAAKEGAPAINLEPMKITPTWCADGGDPSIPIFLATKDPWEGETVSGETSSDDEHSYSSNGYESFLDTTPQAQHDAYAAGIYPYSAFSGMPRFF